MMTNKHGQNEFNINDVSNLKDSTKQSCQINAFKLRQFNKSINILFNLYLVKCVQEKP